MTEVNYYLIRAMYQSPEEFDIFFKNNIVAVGWSEIDFSKYNEISKLREDILKVYGGYLEGANPSYVSKQLNMACRFKSIKSGDRIIIPHCGSICLAEACEEEIYDLSVKKEYDLSNQRRVKYLKTKSGEIKIIPRENLSEALQRRIKVRGTSCGDLNEFADELKNLFEKEEVHWNIQSEEKEEEIEQKFKDELLQIIQCGKKTFLKSGGRGLEELIVELLEIEGYQAKILSKNRFPDIGDADIEASKSDRFFDNKLLIQVKHHQGESGIWGAEQLKHIIDNNKDLLEEYKFMLITTGEPSKDLSDLCDKNEIELIDGKRLCDWIFDSLLKLSYDTKRKLNLSDAPQFLS